MRVLTISDEVEAPTGFGGQHAIMAEGIAQSGAEVFALGLFSRKPLRRTGAY